MVMLPLNDDEAKLLAEALTFVLDCEPPEEGMEFAVENILARLKTLKREEG